MSALTSAERRELMREIEKKEMLEATDRLCGILSEREKENTDDMSKLSITREAFIDLSKDPQAKSKLKEETDVLETLENLAEFYKSLKKELHQHKIGIHLYQYVEKMLRMTCSELIKLYDEIRCRHSNHHDIIVEMIFKLNDEPPIRFRQFR
jgi:hypothetical protein